MAVHLSHLYSLTGTTQPQTLRLRSSLVPVFESKLFYCKITWGIGHFISMYNLMAAMGQGLAASVHDDSSPIAIEVFKPSLVLFCLLLCRSYER